MFGFKPADAFGRLKQRSTSVLPVGRDARDGALSLDLRTPTRRGWHRLKLVATAPIVSLSFEPEGPSAYDRPTHTLVHGERWSGYVYVGRRARNLTLRIEPAASGQPRVVVTLRRIGLAELAWKAGPQRLRRPGLWRAWLDPDPVLFVADAFPGSKDFRAPALDYDEWLRRHEERRQSDLLAALAAPGVGAPSLSLLMAVSGADGAAAVASVQSQTSPAWELVIAVADVPPKAARHLAGLARRDTRIRIVLSPDGGLAGALNRALAQATSPFVARLDPTDRLSPRAVELCLAFLARHPETELLYTDEDRVHRGARRTPYFKPDFSPELLRSCDYFGRLTVLRRERLCNFGGWPERSDGLEDYELALCFAESLDGARLRHVPAVLCHRLQLLSCHDAARPLQAAEAAASVVSQHLRRCGVNATATPTPSGHVRVRYAVPDPSPLVSIIVPTRDKPDVLSTCVRSILAKTDYEPYEILIVDNGSTEAATAALLDELRSRHGVKVLPFPGPFNFSRLNNRAVDASEGSILCFLNNDTEVISSDWLAEMAGRALQPGVGCVGAKLYYGGGTVQHAGVVIGGSNVADHAFRGYPGSAAGYFGRLAVASNYSALTGACLMIRRSIFLEVGGFDETAFPITFNDIDLCLKVMARGYRNVWTPFAELYHRELTTRGPDNTPERIARLRREAEMLAARYGDVVAADPFYSPLMSAAPVNFSPCLADAG